jgi:hypothetical protein
MSPYNQTYFKPIGAGLVAWGATYILDYLIFAQIGPLGVIINIIFLLVVYATTILALGLTEDDYFILNKLFKRLRPWLPKKFHP